MPPSFNLSLAVKDLDTSEAFYGGILALPVERFLPGDQAPPLLLLPQGDACLLIREIAAAEAMHPGLLQNLHRHPLGVGISLEFTVDSLTPIRRQLERTNWPILYELEDRQFEREELWVHDPDGYLVILHREPKEAKEVDENRGPG
ncbi:VOC family protein [Desulfuromonas sp. AOP6]|uniref:VOC family protein n=1 Tax=Desulfuromonas sp. AOP6 TaxID=1566351 RepID=UPI00126BD4A2|nr:VOC family protein [Desulfuromonas sp. AOP6]BCA80942.1 glyoxalase [Desulfuromonas sp. AOP6]